MRRLLAPLLLRPFAAAAIVAAVVAMPVMVLGEVADNEARGRARAEMLASGAGVAERTVLALERSVVSLRTWLAQIASGDLRAAVAARDGPGIYDAAVRAIHGSGCVQSTFIATRVAVVAADGALLMELNGPDGECRGRTQGFQVLFGQEPTVEQFRGRRDEVAASLIPLATRRGVEWRPKAAPYELPYGSVVGEPVVRTLRGVDWTVVPLGHLVIRNDASRETVGLLLMEIPVAALDIELAPFVREAEDVYLVDRTGRFLLSGRPHRVAPLADLTATPVVAKAIRSQPVIASSGSVRLTEDGADPFTGAIRPFATAVMNETGWQVLVVPGQAALRAVEATLLQLRLFRLGLVLALIGGAFVLAAAARAIARQRQALATANAEIAAVSRHKSAFLANMSHELRTPLNAIIGFADVLEQRVFGPLTDKQREYLDDIRSSGRHLLSLVNDVLDLSKVEAGKMDLERRNFSLPASLAESVTFVQARADEHRITISLDIDPSLGAVTADERKVRQVVTNLLSNAVKFTPDGGHIDVRARPEGGGVAVAVADTGPGIPPEERAHIFDEFGQAKGTTEGTGLGLTLSKKFVELHGGRIWVDSEVGRGSTFTFALPLMKEDAKG